MDLGGGFMAQAQSAEDGALGILRACADPDARSALGDSRRARPPPYRVRAPYAPLPLA